MASPTSRSKERAARWRFWSLVFIKVRRLRLSSVSGARLTVTLDIQGEQMSDTYYDTAQICLNGHVVNTIAAASPQSN